MIYSTQQKSLLQGYHQPYKRKNRAVLVSCTILLIACYLFTYRNHLTSSKVTYAVNQLVMCILVQIWAFYNDAF